MKNLLPLILCFLLLSGCIGEPGATPVQKPEEEKTVITPGSTATASTPIRVEESFETREDLLNFTAAIDPKTYPEDDGTLSGMLEPLASKIQEDGYMIAVEAKDGQKREQDNFYEISSDSGYFGQHYTISDALVEGIVIGYEVSYIPAGRETYVEAGIEAYMAEFYPGYARSDNWKESGNVLNCYMATVMINGEELPCSVFIPAISAPKIRLFWDEKIISIFAVGQDDMDLSLFEHLTLEKVPLPPKAEAQVWLQEWKLTIQKELENAIAAEQEAALGTPQAPESTDDAEDPQNDNFLDVPFSEREQLLDFIVTADAQYPNNRTKQDGIFSDIFAFAKEAGYIYVLSDNGVMLESDSWIITACRDLDNRGFAFLYTVADHEFFIFSSYLRSDQRDPFIEADISTCLKTYFPDYPRPDNWKEHDRITDCYFADWAFDGTSIQCIVEQGIVGKDEDQHEYYKLYACYDHMLLTINGWGTFDKSLLSRIALEKVLLPSEKEAQDHIDAREKADSEAAAAAEEEARLGTPQALKFVPTQGELLTFMATVDEKTYPAEGDRGQGLLSPLVGTVRAEGYLLLPYADGAPAEPKEGYCTAYSLQTFADMSACAVEGFRAGNGNKLYAYFAWYPSAEQAELLKQGIETFKQAQETLTVNLENWKDSGYIKDYREVTFTLNGEEQTGFATVRENCTKLEFIYDGKLITLTCFEEGADSFDLSLFEHLTLEKVPLPE